ncbi:hypothetical protein TNCV_3580001 [Trichonephila clavipes]|nr:hypothetical protein TNCV_3580001 [Trichonephila clavipes]
MSPQGVSNLQNANGIVVSGGTVLASRGGKLTSSTVDQIRKVYLIVPLEITESQITGFVISTPAKGRRLLNILARHDNLRNATQFVEAKANTSGSTAAKHSVNQIPAAKEFILKHSDEESPSTADTTFDNTYLYPVHLTYSFLGQPMSPMDSAQLAVRAIDATVLSWCAAHFMGDLKTETCLSSPGSNGLACQPKEKITGEIPSIK